MEGVIILLVFAVVIILGVPIGNAIGIATVVGYLLLRNSLIIIPQKMFMGVNSFTYLCIPFFVLASDIMTDGGITRAILNFCNKFIGHICGGLAHVNVVASAFFAGITGSATADAVGLGKLEIDMMREAGYPDDFSAGITAASAILGPIIPPSNSMILYATIAGNIPVVMLFLGGIVPGLIIAALLMAYCYYVSKKKNILSPAKEQSSRIFYAPLYPVFLHCSCPSSSSAEFLAACSPRQNLPPSLLYMRFL